MSRKTFVSVSLDAEADKDILRWLQRIPKGERSAAIRDAIRAYIGQGGLTLADVYEAVKDLERRVDAGVVVSASQRSTEGDGWDEPPEAAVALDALADL